MGWDIGPRVNPTHWVVLFLPPIERTEVVRGRLRSDPPPYSPSPTFPVT